MAASEQQIYSVSRLNGEVRHLLESQLGRIWLSGEISNLIMASSGHWYLTLKDNYSQVRCAMFRGKNQQVRFRPANGQQVLVRANISVYEPRGDYQLIIDSMQPAGDGLLAQQFEALKMKLAAEGLFSVEHKQPLPQHVRRIGVITSPTGAAIRDVLHVLKRRDPSLEVIIYPTQVQGDAAIGQIANAIRLANARAEVDVLLLTRGGGSLEDLWCFNSETVAREIFASQLPIVSAVGHEVDTSISDYVADVRAPTPSAGAELLSGDRQDKQVRLQQLQQRLRQSWAHYRLNRQQQLQQFDYRLQRQDPQRQLQLLTQRFDEQQLRLNNAMQRVLNRHSNQLQRLEGRLSAQHPKHQLNYSQQQLNHLQHKLTQLMQQQLSQADNRIQRAAHSLQSVSPLATLSRGYSISKNAQDHVINDASAVQIGDEMKTLLKQGTVYSNITKIEP
ncbi:exodeoxyribonuclease VII large subunit [Shewanella sp. C32]|uniref:Exodeoxyribonuclease 7 large subunit n=1 Tax=Shewanella electrica TaxID=515560 RepID=A0ABT2FJM5_9GAMM|nr:exodeoxyribonuclease VII large subunit [Shewanella electrica]MCH1923327.1 exodeoxyribonuclease VII large subunit [Shewanella electrica]MCS4555424.1 exodeoxyribonuclease VII large subunit [Shewanella electrica]